MPALTCLPARLGCASLLAGFLAFLAPALRAQTTNAEPRPRLVITADPELDDNNSLIRLLLYSTDVELEGLIYASSQFHWKGDGKGSR